MEAAESHFISAWRLAPELAIGPIKGPKQLLK